MNSIIRINRLFAFRYLALQGRNRSHQCQTVLIRKLTKSTAGRFLGYIKTKLFYWIFLVNLDFSRFQSTETSASPQEEDYHNIIKNTEKPIGENKLLLDNLLILCL